MMHRREGEILIPGEVNRIFKDHGIVASAISAAEIIKNFKISRFSFYKFRNLGRFREVAPKLYSREDLICFFCQNPKFLVSRMRG